MAGLLRHSLSRWYFTNRAKAGVVGRDGDIQQREKLFRSGRDAVQSYQLDRLCALLRHAGKYVPYYRDLFAEIGFDLKAISSLNALSRLPILDKAAVREASDRMISEAINRCKLRKNASGGSTGAPLQFYQGEDYDREATLTAPLFDQWTGWRRGEVVCLLWGAPTDLERYRLWRQRVRNWLQNRFLVDAFDIDDAKLEYAVEMIRRRRPVLVIAYASAAYLVARYMQRHDIKLDHPPRAVLCSAEVLWPRYREVIEERFGCKAYNRYGSREVGMIAMECEHGTMHANDTGIIVEVENPNENGVGNLVVTQLDNIAFPFIRYRIGDVGAVSYKDCPCGRALSSVTDLVGRVGDYIVAPDGMIIHGEWFTHLFYDVEGVALFTFRQTDSSRYVFEVQKDKGFNEGQFDHAIKTAQKKLGSSANVRVEFVERFETTPSGKHRFVINECPELITVLNEPEQTPTDAEHVGVDGR